MKIKILGLAFPLFLASCSSLYSESFHAAAAEDLLAPANIAVLPCISWPEKQAFSHSAPLVYDYSQMEKACKLYDTFILSSFNGQPFMKGKTPRLIQKALDTAGKPDLIAQLPRLIEGSALCDDCQGPLSYFRTTLFQNKGFQKWMIDFKKASPQSDALLLPVVFDHREVKDQDRGLDRALRSTKISLLLIRTYNDSIQWYSTRVGQTSSVFSSPAEFKWPDWSLVYEQVFIDSLWKDFPGYQIYRD